MKRDLKTLNKTLALAIAAAMAMTSAPGIAFADDFGDGTVAEAEAVVAEEEEESVDAAAEAETEEAAEAEAAEEIETESEETVQEETAAAEDASAQAEAEDLFSSEVDADAAGAATSEAKGTQGTPAQVTGVQVVTDSEVTSYPKLSWNYVPGAYEYRIVVKDSMGNVYKYYDGEDYSVSNSEFPSVGMTFLKYVYLSKSTDGGKTYSEEPDANGNYTNAYKSGQTYTISVYAVNKYSADGTDSNAVETPGPVSAEVTYTVPSNVGQITINDLAYVSQDDNYVYFTYTGNITDGYLDYEVSEKSDFSPTKYVDDNSYGNYKFALEKDYLDAGKTYYVHVGNRVNGELQKDAAGKEVWSNTVSFTVDAAKTLKAITGLKLYNTTADDFEFRFDPVLESGDLYVLEYSEDVNFSKDKTESLYNSTTISKGDLKSGVEYNVRVRTYESKYNYETDEYEYAYGTPSNVVTISRTEAPSLRNIQVAEKTPSGFVLKYTGNLNEDDSIEFWVSSDKNFASDRTKTGITSTADDKTFTISYNEFTSDRGFSMTPGKTYYVKARTYSGDKDLYDSYKEESYYGPFTNVVTIKPTVPNATVVATVASTSIRLELDSIGEYGYFKTGYIIQKKVGKKWKTISTNTNGVYTDKKLKKDTAYTYRVQAYYRDTKANKTYKGAYTYYSATTWGGNLNLVATPASKTSVKLSWNKISGAKGYEVYRAITNSDGYNYSGDKGTDNSYIKYTLVKDIKKGSAKSYTVKKLTSGMTYEFVVKAYKTVKGKKVYIEGTSSCQLGFGDIVIYKKKVSANGTTKITWKPVYGANGYLIEKQDNITGDWSTVKTIKKVKTTSWTAKAGTESENYRIRAYKNGTPKTYSKEDTFTVSPKLAAPTGVKATANKDGSIKISWKAVAGAAYYKVYRTTSAKYTYNKDSKSYNYYDYYSDYYGDYNVIPYYVADASAKSGYSVSDDELTATSIVDRKISYTNNSGGTTTLYDGPDGDVTYYYYVVAYKYVGGAYNTVSSKENSVVSSGDSKAASAKVSVTKVSKPTLKSVKAASKKVTVTWKKVANANGYEVYRSTKKGSGYTLVGTVTKGSTVKFVDKTAKKGKKYYYKVRATRVNQAGLNAVSGYSKVKSVKAK